MLLKNNNIYIRSEAHHLNMLAESVLISLGLTEKEAKAYLSLLRIGESTATKISEDVNIDRTLIYQIMNRLIENGLVNYIIKNNVRYFSAVRPRRLMEKLKEKEENLSEVMPELENMIKSGEETTKVELYRGTEGIKTVWRGVLREGREYVIFGEEGNFQKLMPNFMKEFLRDVVKYGSCERILSKDSKRGKIYLTKNSDIRYLPDEYFSPTMTVVTDNKVINFVWSKPYYAIVTKNNEIAKSFKSYFEMMWKFAKE